MDHVDQAVLAKTYEQRDRRWVVAQQIWIVLVTFASSSARMPDGEKRLTYDALASDLGWIGRDRGMKVRSALSLVGMYCAINDLPMLNLLVVDPATGRPGTLALIPRENASLASIHRKALAFRWSSIRVPSPGAFRRINVQWNALAKHCNVEMLK